MEMNNNEVDSAIGDEPANDEIDVSDATLTEYHSDSEEHAFSYDDTSDEDIDELEMQ